MVDPKKITSILCTLAFVYSCKMRSENKQIMAAGDEMPMASFSGNYLLPGGKKLSWESWIKQEDIVENGELVGVAEFRMLRIGGKVFELDSPPSETFSSKEEAKGNWEIQHLSKVLEAVPELDETQIYDEKRQGMVPSFYLRASYWYDRSFLENRKGKMKILFKELNENWTAHPTTQQQVITQEASGELTFFDLSLLPESAKN